MDLERIRKLKEENIALKMGLLVMSDAIEIICGTGHPAEKYRHQAWSILEKLGVDTSYGGFQLARDLLNKGTDTWLTANSAAAKDTIHELSSSTQSGASCSDPAVPKGESSPSGQMK